jgi:AcrR family transcriptional regulator
MSHSGEALDDPKILIARAVHRTILEHGLQGVNLREIARELSVTTGFLSHYFRNKAELLLFSKDLLMQDLMAGARVAGASAHGWERLQTACEHLLPLTAERADAWLVFFAYLGGAVGDQKLMQVQVGRYRRGSHKFFEGEIRELVSSGQLQNTIDLEREALALASFVDGLVINALFSPVREKHDLQRELLRSYIDQLRQGQGMATESARRQNGGKRIEL